MIIFFKNIILSVIFILIIFTPPISFLPYYTWLLAFMGILTLTNVNFVRLIGFGNKYNRYFLIYFTIIFIFNSLIVPFTHNFVDFTYIPLLIGIILTILRSILLIYCLYKFEKREILSQYCKYFFIACSVYVAFTLIFIINPGFKQFWLYSILTKVEDKSIGFAVYEFRYSLDGFAAFSSASVFSFACLFCCYLIAANRNVNILQTACLIIMVIGCFFYGRISLVGMLLGTILIVWTTDNIGKTIRVITIIVIFAFTVLAVLNVASQSNESLIAWQEWAFSIVKQLFVEKEVTDYSVTHMVEDMYYMPDAPTFLFGDGQYTEANGSYYGHTDVGFMRLILYGGIIDLLLVYSLLIYLSRIIIRTSKSLVFKRFIFLAIILFFILEMKGESYQRAIMMLYPLFLIQNYKSNDVKSLWKGNLKYQS